MKFKKKPVVIEAVQYTATLFQDKTIVNWKELQALAGDCLVWDEFGFIIKTLEGNMRLSPGDWLLKGIKGEYYPCKPDIFEQTYEKVDE